MKKKIFTVFAVIILLITLSGCDTTNQQNSTNQQQSSYLNPDDEQNKIDALIKDEQNKIDEMNEKEDYCRSTSKDWEEEVDCMVQMFGNNDKKVKKKKQKQTTGSRGHSYWYGNNYCVKIPNDGDWYECTRPDGSTYSHTGH